MNIGGFLRRNVAGIVLLLNFSGCTGIVLRGAFQHAILGARRQVCQSNLKVISLACQLYQADYDEKFSPLSDGGSRGWTSLLTHYKPALDFSCPAGYKSSFSPASDYFFNARLATRKSASVRDSMSTIAFGDGQDNGPTNSHLVELPNDWNNKDSFTQRHYIFANYLFADGHVKLIKSSNFAERNDYNTGESEMRYKFSPDEVVFHKTQRREVTPSSNPATSGVTPQNVG